MARISRRRFLERGMWAAATAAAAMAPGARALAALGKPRGPNGTLAVGVIGVKGRGMAHVNAFTKMKDVRVVAICDVDENVIGRASKAVEEATGKAPAHYQDARTMLEDASLDAVSIATCNHTHTLLSCWALHAGKHVYVEKPLSHNVREGEVLLETARRRNLVVQHGTQSRSSPGLREAMAFVNGGGLGKVTLARGLCYKRRKSIGTRPEEAPPEGVNYDLWLGPAPVRAFTRNRFHYNWHWHWDYGNGDVGNQGVHEMDRARWGLGVSRPPRRVLSLGGRLGYEDDGETPNTLLSLFDYGKRSAPLIFEVRGLDTEAYRDVRIGVILECEGGYVINPSYASATVFDADGKKVKSYDGWGDHFRNFVDAVLAGDRTKVNAPPEEGHPSAALCHYANVSHRAGKVRRLRGLKEPFGSKEADETLDRLRAHLDAAGVDPRRVKVVMGAPLEIDKAGGIAGNSGAARMLTREYRKPFVLPPAA